MSLRDYPYVPNIDEERPSPPVCVCYGCMYLEASPMVCGHPEAHSVRYDMVRSFTYKLPSVEMCCRSGNRCTFYTPDKFKSIDFDEKDEEKKEKKKKIKDLIEVIKKDKEEKPKE
jgi:hypothetical protein